MGYMVLFFNKFNIVLNIFFFVNFTAYSFFSCHCGCSSSCGCNKNKDQLNSFNDNNKKILTKGKNPGFKESVKESEPVKTKESIIPEQTYPKIDIDDKNFQDLENPEGDLDVSFNDVKELKDDGKMTKIDDKKDNLKNFWCHKKNGYLN